MFAELKGVKLYYEEVGTGEPVILIAGINSNHRFWKGMIPLLEGYRVITMDNRGVGQTEYDGEITIDGVADDVIGLMDMLGIQKAHIVGWSWGSQISQSLVMRYMDRVQTLTLVSSYQFRPYRSAYFMSSLASIAKEGGISAESMNVTFNAFCLPESAFEKMAKNGISVPIPKHPEDPAEIIKQIRSMDDFDSTEHTKDIKVPTLVVHGAADIMVEPKKGRAIGQAIEGCTYIEIPDMGHTIPPEYYIEPLKKLLAEHKM